MHEIRQAARAKDLHLPSMLALPNVVGVGVGLRQRAGRVQDEICIVALVRRKRPATALAPEALVPAEVEGVPIDVLEVGDLRAQVNRKARLRPAPGGVSLGHYQITTGTFGCVVRDQASGVRLILSNNHVLANGNDAVPEDPILQPGAADGGREESDTIALLERFAPLAYNHEPATCGVARFVVAAGNFLAGAIGSKHRLESFREDAQATNRVDAAVARPLIDGDISDEILDIGRLTGTGEPTLGMAVRKSGRSSGLTTGTITIVETTLDVDYGGKTARFEGQVVSGSMSRPGDSGSVLVAADSPTAVGLLFAGSDQATIYNPIGAVFAALGIEIR